MSESNPPAELVPAHPVPLFGEDDQPSLRKHYVYRLRRLLQLRSQHHGELNQDGLWLLDRSIFATYCDCVQAGAGMAAQHLLRSLTTLEGAELKLPAASKARRR